MYLKEKLAELRSRQGLTQGELAAKINVSRQTVYKWERGIVVPSAENLIALGRLYGVPLEELADSTLPLTGQPAVAVAEEPPMPEEPEAPRPVDGEAPGKRGRNIAAHIGLAVCLVLVAVASVITIWSAIFKEREKPENETIRVEDMEPDYIDPSELIPFDGTWKIIE